MSKYTPLHKGAIVRKVTTDGYGIGPFMLVEGTKKNDVVVRYLIRDLYHTGSSFIRTILKERIQVVSVCTIRVPEKKMDALVEDRVNYLTHKPDKMWNTLADGAFDLIRIQSRTRTVYFTYKSVKRLCKMKENIFARRKIDRFAKYVPFIKLALSELVYVKDK